MSAQKIKPSGVLGALGGLVGLSALAGVLVTALVTPFIALTGMTAKAGVDVFNSLPDYLAINQLTQQNVIYGLDANGNDVEIARIYAQNREEVGWDDVSQYVKDAVVAIEDRRFYEHGGVDIPSIVRAAVGNVAGGEIDSGASTLTMQLVKNIKIQDAMNLPTEAERKAGLAEAQEKTMQRKLMEAKLAIGLEKNYTKNDILLAYLNIAGFGGNTYGIESAAKQFFSVSAKDVTLAQAASLVAIVQTPSYHSLNNEENFADNKIRRDGTLRYMLQLGYITQAEFDEAIATPIEVKYSSASNGCMYASSGANFCDYVTSLVPELTMLGNTVEERREAWRRGGYQVYTSLQINQQDYAEKIVRQYAPADFTSFQLGAAVSVVEPGTGRIRVMAQNKSFNNTQDGGDATQTAVNFNTDYTHGASTGFQGGSTYKLATLAAWLEAGHGLNEVVNGARRVFNLSTFKNCNGTTGGTYNPPNFGGSGGSSATTVMQATAQSYNISYVAMAQQLEQCDIASAAEALGIQRADGGDLTTNPASILGTNEVSPLAMATAIATVAAGGLHCEPRAIDRIVDVNGNDLGGQPKVCTQNITPEVAAAMAHALRGVMTNGTGTVSNPRDGVETIGKSGTTDYARHLWMIGASTTNAVSVWTGNIVGKADLSKYNIAGTYGSMVRHVIFKPIMQALDAQYGGGAFPKVSAELLNGTPATVPNVVGQTQEQAKALIESLGFTYLYGGEASSSIATGLIASMTPAGGSSVPKGSIITVYGSKGDAIAMPDVTGQSFSAAESYLLGQGFTTVVEGCSTLPPKANPGDPDDPNLDKVVSSSPAPGADVVPGTSTVTLNVAKYTCP